MRFVLAAPSPSPSRLEQGVLVCLHLLVFLVPLAMSNLSWLGIGGGPLTYDQFDLVKVFILRALVLVAGALWIWRFLASRGRLLSVKALWLLVGFLILLALSTALSVHVPTAFAGKYRRYEGLFTLLSYAGLFFLALQTLDTTPKVRSIARTIVASGALVAAYGLAQYLGYDPVGWGATSFEAGRSFSTLGNPNLLGGFLIFPLALAPGLALSEDDLRIRAVYWGAFALVASCLLTSFTRGAWLGGGVALCIMGFAVLGLRPRWLALDWGLLVGGAVGFVALVLGSLRSDSNVMNFPFRLASMFQPNTGSGQTRTEIWKAAWRAIGDRPFFGHGLDTFRLLFPRYKTARYVADAGHGSIADNAHNYPLQLAMGAGIPGAMLAYGFFGLVLWRAAPFAFQRSTSADRLPLAGFWAACIGYLVHLMFGLSVVGSSFLLWLALGLLLASSVQSVEVTIPRGSKAAAAGLTALMVLAFLVNASFLVADRHYLMAKDSTQVMGDRIAHLKMAMRLNPANDPYRSEVGYAHMEGVADLLRKEELLQQGVQGAAGELTQARQAIRDAATGFEEAINHSPLEYDNYLNLAALYNQASSLDASYAADALWWAERGMAIEPYGPGVLYQAALAQDLLGQREAAIVLLQKAAAMDPNYPAPQVKLRELQRQQPAVNAHP